MFKMLLQELSAEYSDLLLHTEIRWLSRGRILKRFLSLLSEVKGIMLSKEENASLHDEPVWLLDLAFLTEKLNHLNRELQGKDKTVAHVISAVNALKAEMSIFSAQVEKNAAFFFSAGSVKRQCFCICSFG